MKNQFINFLKNNKSFLLFLTLMMVFRSAVADWNEVPTGSMKPTIVEGDRIFVNKMAYDLRVPFTNTSIYKIADPERGDIIIFDSEASQKRLVKRVVGVPGDKVELRNNVLFINDQRLQYQDVANTSQTRDRMEKLSGVEHLIRVSKNQSPIASFRAVVVPENHYLALGDNRDNSADSRVIGFVPRNEIVGKTDSVVLSFNYDNYYIPRKERFFKSI